MKGLIIAKLTETINSIVFFDGCNTEMLLSLENSCFKINFTDISISIYMQFHSDHVEITTEPKLQAPDVEISGSSVNILGASIHKNISNISIVGDVKLAKKLEQLLSKVEIPIANILSKTIGPNTAYWYESATNSIKQKLKSTSDSAKDNIDSYVNEELGLCVREEEFNDFKRRVSQVRDRVSIIEKRRAKHGD